jgi:hypothetical protein
MDDYDEQDYIENAGSGPRVRPAAKDLLGGMGAQVLRGMLLTSPDEIYSEYGFSPEDASVTLACCELAELRFWDADAIIEAACAGGTEEQRVMWGYESREKLARRIALIMKGENLPTHVTAADGVLLLRRLGISVFHELLDAVAVVSLEPFTEESQRVYRLLKGIPESERVMNSPASPSATLPPPLSVAPWLVADPRDARLKAFEPWGTPARYFARQLVTRDDSLRHKRAVLDAKVADSLLEKGIKKRGGIVGPDVSTILKAFSKLDFS